MLYIHQPANEMPLKSNGVSGHFYYIFYQGLLTHYLACLLAGSNQELARKGKKKTDVFEAICGLL